MQTNGKGNLKAVTTLANIFTNSIINKMWLWTAEGSVKHGFSAMI
jgi:hypothetical protein